MANTGRSPSLRLLLKELSDRIRRLENRRRFPIGNQWLLIEDDSGRLIARNRTTEADTVIAEP